MVEDRRASTAYPVITLQRTPDVAREAGPQADRRVVQLAETAIDDLDDRRSKKVLISAVLAAARLSDLRRFAAILKANKHETFGDYFVFLISELEDDFGSAATVSILRLFADAGVNVTNLNYSLNPLGAVATFKSMAKRFKILLESGDLSEDEMRRVRRSITEAEDALRAIEGKLPKPGQVKRMSAVAVAAGWAWRSAGALVVDDATGIGVADDVAIPFVVAAAIILSGIALFAGSKPEILDYGPAMAKVEAAVREITGLLGATITLMAENVADTGIMGEVHELIAAATAAGAALTICAALEQLMAAAKRARDTARINKIKATQKAKGCRHSRHG
jgi:hypothetical protein